MGRGWMRKQGMCQERGWVSREESGRNHLHQDKWESALILVTGRLLERTTARQSMLGPSVPHIPGARRNTKEAPRLPWGK